MEKNIEKYVFVKQNFLDNEFCQYAIEKLNRAEAWETQKILRETHEWEYDYDGDDKNESGQPEEPETIPTSKGGWEYIDNLKFEWYKDAHALVDIKFLKYSLNQSMKIHCDHVHSIFDGKKKGIPILTVIGLFNDDFEGGNLVLFEDKNINVKEGGLVIFPSIFLFPHQVKAITKGNRYSYTTWVW